MADVCVIGGGPAGSVFAARMAQLGHAVTLVERSPFPRRHLGESLSPGTWPMLETIGAREAVASAGFRPVRRVEVLWASGLQVREDPREEALIVERGAFDRILLDRARELGVRVLQPARAAERRYDGKTWAVDVHTESGAMRIEADLIADASGRGSASSQRVRTAAATLALYAWWQGVELPPKPRIEAGDHAWFWSVPLPDGTCNILAFADVAWFRTHRAGSLEEDYRRLLRSSSLGARAESARLVTPVRGIDATPFLDEGSVTPSSIRIGEAALAIDPVSSSGVQKAIQSALAGAVVANTLLRRPSAAEAAMEFYRSSLAEASGRHVLWAAGHYASVAVQRKTRFWEERAREATAAATPEPISAADAATLASVPVALSQELEFVDLPCIAGDFVEIRTAVRHPRLDGPLVYLGGHEVAPLLRQVRFGSTPLQMARMWLGQLPLGSGLAIAGWLFNNGLLACDSLCAGPVHELPSGVAEKP